MTRRPKKDDFRVIFDNIRRAKERLEAAAARAGRDPKGVELVAVTKYATPAQTSEALASGLLRQIGESRIQDAAGKRERAKAEGWPPATWRMIGHLQTNKAKKALDLFDTVDSLDSLRLAETLDRQLSESGKTLPVLVQVKLTEKETQGGVSPEAAEEFIGALGRFSRLNVEGLMTIAPMVEPVEKVRPYFQQLKTLSDRISRGRNRPWILSMGMSRDYEIAVEEGATMVRLGSVLFDLDQSYIAGKHSKGG